MRYPWTFLLSLFLFLEIKGDRDWLSGGEFPDHGGRGVPGGTASLCGVWRRRLPGRAPGSKGNVSKTGKDGSWTSYNLKSALISRSPFGRSESKLKVPAELSFAPHGEKRTTALRCRVGLIFKGALAKIFVKKILRFKFEECLWFVIIYITLKQTPLVFKTFPS